MTEETKLQVIPGEGSLIPTTVAGDQFVLVRLAREIRDLSTPDKLSEYYNKLEVWAKSIEAFTNNIKAKLLLAVKDKGHKATEKGSLRLESNGWQIDARITRSGIDSKKFEHLLQSKDIDPARFMNMDIKYVFDETRAAAAIKSGIITEQELINCKYDVNYSLMPPKKVY